MLDIAYPLLYFLPKLLPSPLGEGGGGEAFFNDADLIL